MVRKEVATHLLAYNLIRGIMAAAARAAEVKPRRLSFQGSLHTVRAFEEVPLYDPRAARSGPAASVIVDRQEACGDRPDRSQPRAVKRRPKPHPLLRMPACEGQTPDQTRDNAL